MIFKGKSSYNEFIQSEEEIATNILADRLNFLESQKFVEKLVANDKKSKFTYILTEKSISLIPVIIELAVWGTSYFPLGVNPDLIIEFEPDREETINKYKELARKRAKKLRQSKP